jgi:RNA polymerase sigma-70 factor (ECF subfamily)
MRSGGYGMNGSVVNSRTAEDNAGRGAGTPAPDGAAGDASSVAERRKRFEHEALAHLDALYAFALKLSRSRDDAEDLVGDTMLRAFDRWDQYNLGTNIRAWLFTILYHVFVSRKRRVDAIDPEGKFYDSFLDDEVTKAIESLPEEYRSAVVLSDLHDLRYSEIAEILGVPEGTVKSRLFRGRRLLQKKLVDYAVDMNYIKRPAA